MRNLIPLDFAQLGWTEWAWLALAFGGLSLLAPQGRWRRKLAWGAGLVIGLFGLLRMPGLARGTGSWERWIGPVLFAPAFSAGIVLFGAVRVPRLGRFILGALVALTLLGRPFGRDPLRGAHEWVFLAFWGLGLAYLVAGEGGLRRFLRRPVAPRIDVGSLLAGAFFVFCTAVRPLGAGWIAALTLLFLLRVVHAVVEQGKEMRRYVVRRLISAPIVLLVLLLLSFVLMRTAPGGPFDKEKNVGPEMRALQERQYGYDKPVLEQFRRYMVHLLWDGELGISTKQRGKKINEIIATHLGPSVRLGLAAIALALIIGITAGLIAGIRQNSIFDYSSMAAAMLGLALPTFVVGPLLVLAFAMKFEVFHVAGWERFPRDLILPAITLSLPFTARLARLTRAGMLEIINQDYIRTARAKGLSEPVIVLRHTLKGTLLPVVSFLGPAIAQLLTGSLVVEKIFQVPGLGFEFVESALSRDYALAMGLVLLFGTLLILFNLVVDVAYAFLDPRIRHG